MTISFSKKIKLALKETLPPFITKLLQYINQLIFKRYPSNDKFKLILKEILPPFIIRKLICLKRFMLTKRLTRNIINYTEYSRHLKKLYQSQHKFIANNNEALSQTKITLFILINKINIPTLRAIKRIQKQTHSHYECHCLIATHHPKIDRIIIKLITKTKKFKITIEKNTENFFKLIQQTLDNVDESIIGILNQNTLLSPQTLDIIAATLKHTPDADFIYSDNDFANKFFNIFYNPYFKTNWDPYLLLSQNYIGTLFFTRKNILVQAKLPTIEFSNNWTWDLALRCTELSQKIIHIPCVLYHEIVQKNTHTDASKIITAALQRRHQEAEVINLPEQPYYRTLFKLTENPLVSIIIPTKDRLDLLKPAVESILNKTSYQNFEILIINNNSEKAETLDYLKRINSGKVKVLDYTHPYNFSKINNFAATKAQGSILVLMNNDTEVISPDWLTEMLSLALQPGVGIVGAMLYYPNNTIQHAGVVLGIGGVAAHVYAGFPKDAQGYFNNIKTVRSVSCVTAACLMVTRSAFNAVNGLNIDLAVAYNDVDFCIKVREAGYRLLFTPYAELYHKESATRGKDDTPVKLKLFHKETDYMINKWKNLLLEDPFYNPNLSLQSIHYKYEPTPYNPPCAPAAHSQPPSAYVQHVQ